MKEGFFEDKQRKQHEDREASYFVIFRFIFVLSIVTRIRREKRSGTFNTRPRDSMSDKEKFDQEETDISEQEEDLEKKIKKEIDKLKFYLEEGDELLESCDYSEIALTYKRTDEIQDRLNDLVSTLRELKIDRGI